MLFEDSTNEQLDNLFAKHQDIESEALYKDITIFCQQNIAETSTNTRSSAMSTRDYRDRGMVFNKKGKGARQSPIIHCQQFKLREQMQKKALTKSWSKDAQRF